MGNLVAGVSWLRNDGVQAVEDAAGVHGLALTARVHTPEGAVLLVGVCDWGEGRRDVRTLRVANGASEYEELLTRFRIGVHELDASHSYMELTIPGPSSTGRLSALRASPDDLNGVAKSRFAEILAKHGVSECGTKGALLEATRRREYLMAVFPSEAFEAAIAVYVLCRVAPFSRFVQTGGPWVPGTTSPQDPSELDDDPALHVKGHSERRSPSASSSAPVRKNGLEPTAEQQAVIDFANSRTDLVVEALAGTGKTSTLKMFAEATTKGRGQYLAFNRAIVNAASGVFPSSVSCRTAHQLAYAGVGYRYAKRLNGNRLTNKQLAQHLQCEPFAFTAGDVRHYLTPDQVARYGLAAVREFCKSVDAELGPEHVPVPPLIAQDPRVTRAFRSHICLYAQETWKDLADINGVLPWNKNHDLYLKLWQLTDPVINADYILFDEAQDADPVMLTVVNDQDSAQLVYCGDDYQTLYEWRGAKNALSLAPVDQRLWLTQSFRFGIDVAGVANELLRRLKAPHLIVGNPARKTRLGSVATPDAIVCRTNSAVIESLVEADRLGRKAAVLGGALDLANLATGVAELQAGRRTSHPDLAPFQSWQEVKQWLEDSPEQSPDLAKDIKLIERFGPPAIKRIIGKIVPEDQAAVTITTVHQAKGREWLKVRLASDFKHPDDMETEELRVAYVAVTRGKDALDLNGLFSEDRRKENQPQGGRSAPQRSTAKRRPRIKFT